MNCLGEPVEEEVSLLNCTTTYTTRNDQIIGTETRIRKVTDIITKLMHYHGL